MSEIEEVSKAVQKVAQFGEKSLDSADKLGGFLTRMFKEPFAELSGIITDRLRFVRWKRLVRTADEVNTILKDRGIKDTRAVPPKLALPLLEKSSLEEDDELHSMWNKLLANAMDPQFQGEIRTAFLDIMSSLTPLDARVLAEVYGAIRRANFPRDKWTTIPFTQKKICEGLKLSSSAFLVSIYNLMRVQCVETHLITIKMGEGLSGPDMKIPSGANTVVLTPLGIAFIEACI